MLKTPAPAGNEVLVRIRAASVNPLDWHFMTGTPYVIRLIAGLRRPKRPIRGVDVAGIVEAAACKGSVTVVVSAVGGTTETLIELTATAAALVR